MEKNDIIIGSAEALGTSGEGIVKEDGITVFVPFLLPGERASIKILRQKGNIAYGKALEVFTPAEERVRPVCPAFRRCGGCQLQHLEYKEQLKFKTRLVQDALRKIGGIKCEVAPCEKSERSYAYRNKLQLPIGRVKGENAVGFYAERSHRIVPIEACPLHPAWSGKLIAAVCQFMQMCGVNGYDEETGEGELRHIVVREVKRRYLVTLVTAQWEIKGLDVFTSLLDGVFRSYSLYLNYHPDNTNVIFGTEFKLIKGKGVYEGTENGITYEAGASTFLQVNEGVRTKLYEHAVSLVQEDETVIDCFSGGGLLTAMFAKKCKKAYGVEIVPEASRCADAIKEKNGLHGKMENYCGTVEEYLPKILAKEPGAAVVLDPPRSGVDRSVLEAIKTNGVQKVIYISCNPATLARDLGLLCGTLCANGRGELIKAEPQNFDYQIELVQPFDMFPQTRHVETLVVLTHEN